MMFCGDCCTCWVVATAAVRGNVTADKDDTVTGAGGGALLFLAVGRVTGTVATDAVPMAEAAVAAGDTGLEDGGWGCGCVCGCGCGSRMVGCMPLKVAASLLATPPLSLVPPKRTSC